MKKHTKLILFIILQYSILDINPRKNKFVMAVYLGYPVYPGNPGYPYPTYHGYHGYHGNPRYPYRIGGTTYYMSPPNPLDCLTEEQRWDYDRRRLDEKCLPKDLVEELGPTPLYSPYQPRFDEASAESDLVNWVVWF